MVHFDFQPTADLPDAVSGMLHVLAVRDGLRDRSVGNGEKDGREEFVEGNHDARRKWDLRRERRGGGSLLEYYTPKDGRLYTGRPSYHKLGTRIVENTQTQVLLF